MPCLVQPNHRSRSPKRHGNGCSPLATLSGAAVAERLPTIRAGDRHLIYSATIGEAQQRGVLQAAARSPEAAWLSDCIVMIRGA